MPMSNSYRCPLQYEERQKIELRVRAKVPIRRIARLLDRNHSMIVRELKRNRRPDGRYCADYAQKLAQKKSRITNKKKIETNAPLEEYIIAQLKEDWSPEEIAGRLKTNPPVHLQGTSVSYETIYQWIYTGEGRWKHLYQYLRKAHPKRYRRKGRKPQKTLIPGRISIHQRPAIITDRKRVGDWESDTVQFSKQREGLSVQYERASMLSRIHKVQNKAAQETETAIRLSIESLPEYLWKSITWDNGGEGAGHVNLKRDYDLQTYFCDAYASWQKGGVENLNGLIRQYLPRSTNISMITDEQVETIQERLNNRPRKKLNFKTPNEIITELSGALNS